MSETLYGLTESQVIRLKRLLDAAENSDRPPLTNSRTQRQPSRSLIGILESPVSATTALTSKPKVGTLNVYSFSSTGVLDTGMDLTVYNFAPQAATTDRWTMADRCSITGKLFIAGQFCS